MVDAQVVEKVRNSFVAQLKVFAASEVHPSWQESALALAASLEARKPTEIPWNRIFPEFLEDAMTEAGVKMFGPEYKEIMHELESPGTPG